MRLTGLVLIATLAGPAASAAEADVEAMFTINSPQVISGIAFHAGDLYAVGKDNALIRYEPQTGQALEEIKPLIPDALHVHLHGIAAGPGNTFWVNETMSGRIYRMAFDGYTVMSTIDAPPGETPAYGLAYDGTFLWVGRHSEGPATPIHKLDPVTGEILQVFDLGVADVHGLAWIADYLWVLDNTTDELHQVDAAGTVMETFTLPENWYGGMAHDGVWLWASNRIDFVHVAATPNPCPAPGEAWDLRFADHSTLTWRAPSVQGGLPPAYETLRSPWSDDFLVAQCLDDPAPTDTSVADPEVPGPGGPVHYLVRAGNACPDGQGTLGVDSAGFERIGAACP